jgi:hypothetical protein
MRQGTRKTQIILSNEKVVQFSHVQSLSISSPVYKEIVLTSILKYTKTLYTAWIEGFFFFFYAEIRPVTLHKSQASHKQDTVYTSILLISLNNSSISLWVYTSSVMSDDLCPMMRFLHRSFIPAL